jgi:putative restriction endonuclease
MQGTIAVTDTGWYEYLSQRALEEVNFWTPSDRRSFRAPEFSPFLFKLKAPHNAICGFAYFARWSSLPDWLAWECFGEGNGCGSLAEMRERIGAIRQRIRYQPTNAPANIGCILLVQPTFFAPDDWIPQPADWHARTVTSKGYDLSVGEGHRVWEACQDRAAVQDLIHTGDLMVVRPPRPRYDNPQITRPRLGQGTFRIAVTEAYDRACSVTDEHSLPALEAAHIRSFSADGPHDVANGIVLRADLHRLFDKGYLTVTPERRLEVSSRLREDFSNGRSYYPLHGKSLRLPDTALHQPDPEHLRWHNEQVYLG